MRSLPRAAGDTLLTLFAVVVIVGAVHVVTADPGVSNADLVSGSPTPTVKSTPTALATRTAPAPSATPSPALDTLVVAGPDFGRLNEVLAEATGAQVIVAESAESEVLAPGALSAITFVPSAVVLEVPAGTRTSARTTTAITSVRKAWPGVRLLVIGPFSSADRKSAGAVQAAATAVEGVTFLDPVVLKWRTNDESATLSEADLTVVAAKLAAALS